jgi:hypothetical protein
MFKIVGLAGLQDSLSLTNQNRAPLELGGDPEALKVIKAFDKYHVLSI